MAAIHRQSDDARTIDGSAEPSLNLPVNRKILQETSSVLYALTMTLDRDESGQVKVVEVKTQHITDSGSIITVS